MVAIVFTPLHLFLLALLIPWRQRVALGRAGELSLVVVMESPMLGEVAEALAPVIRPRDVLLLPGVRAAQGWKARGLVAKNVRTLSRHWPRPTIDRLVCFNDIRAETQFLVSKTRDESQIAYVEDGAVAAYGDYAPLRRGWLRGAAGRLWYGPWFKVVNLPGLHPKITEGHFILPDLTCQALHRLRKHAIPRPSVGDTELRRAAAAMIAALRIDVEELAQIEALVILPHSEELRDRGNASSEIARQLGIIKSTWRRAAAKIHPLEPAPDMLRGIIRESGLAEVPAELLLELVLLNHMPNLRLVVGEASSALINVRWLRPEVRVARWRKADPETSDHPLRRIFAELNIGDLAEAEGGSDSAC